MTQKSNKLISIQYLRAAAAAMVVMVHLVGQLRRIGYAGPWPEWMTAGVDIFFVISGFVMWMTTRTHPCGTIGFFWNRLVRIAPLYWALTSVVAGLMIIFPSLVLSGRFEAHHVIMSYLFLPAVEPFGGLIQPALEPGWTLNYEMYFYVIFGALLFLPERLLLLAVSTWLVASVCVGAFGPTDLMMQFYGAGIVLDFGFGMLLAAVFMRGWVLPSPLAWMALALGFGKLAFPGLIDGPHWFVIGLPALAIVAGAVALERRHGIRRMGSLLLLGDASYSIYLSHGMVLSACFQITRKLGVSGGLFMTPFFTLASCVAVVIVGLLVHFNIEKPLTRSCSAAGALVFSRINAAHWSMWVRSISNRASMSLKAYGWRVS
jgi:peptidoglycan/LPS O-acetylase OafA/YrhL